MGASAPSALLLFCCLLFLANQVTAHVKKLLVVQSVRLEASGSTQIVLSTTAFNPSRRPASLTVRVRVQRPHNRASSDDIVALYTHPSDPRSTLPITWHNLTASSPSYPATGSGNVTFQLLNFRQNFVVRLVGNDTFSPVVLAESAVIKNTNPNAPGQVHLAQHADGSSIVVQWISGSAAPQQLQYSSTVSHFTTRSSAGNTGSTIADAQPKLYMSEGSGASVMLSTVRSYDNGMMCGEPATTLGFIHPGYMHTAVIPGRELGHNRQLHYRVGSPEVGWSEVFSFTSAPEPAAVAQGSVSFTFLVFNDVGQQNSVLFNDTCPPYCPGGWAWVDYTANSTKLGQHLMRETAARLGLLVGDLAYANGVQADWDYFGHQFQAPFSRWPLMVATGNHERDHPHTGDVLNTSSSDSGGECNVPYTYRYYTPAWEAADPYAHKGAVQGSSKSISASSSTSRASESISNRPQGSNGRTSSDGSSTVSSSFSSSMGPVLDQLHHHLVAKWQKGTPEKQADNRKQQQQLHNLPTALNPYKSYYSFSMATVHFLMLDSESPSHKGSPQHSFVVEDLAKVDRSKHPWLVAGLHRMMAGPTTDPVSIQNMARLQADYEELFKQHAVDLVLQGHEHAYARTSPLYKGKCVGHPEESSSSSRTRHGGSTLTSSSRNSSSNAGPSSASQVLQVLEDPQAPVYVLAGHAGAGFTHAFPDVLPSWVAFGVQDQNGYLRVTVGGGKLTLLSISTDDGHVIDGVQIVKKAAAAAGTAAAVKRKE